jgi:hypothetical protein
VVKQFRNIILAQNFISKHVLATAGGKLKNTAIGDLSPRRRPFSPREDCADEMALKLVARKSWCWPKKAAGRRADCQFVHCFLSHRHNSPGECREREANFDKTPECAWRLVIEVVFFLLANGTFQFC